MSNKLLYPLIITLSLALPAGPALASGDGAKLVSTRLAMRDLWIDHIFWVRAVVLADARADKPAREAADRQVVENAREIAKVIEPFYGAAAGDKLFGLLAGHYGAVLDYLAATLPSPAANRQQAAMDKLTANAGEIAEFLSGANPHLPKDALLDLLAAHGGHHISQINQVGSDDFKAEAQTWLAMKQHVYTLADALVSGIAKQFPDSF